MKIGFIGLGNMGAPMVKRLVASGHDITGYDVMESAMAALSEVKMSFSKDILTAAREQDVVITMLPNGEALIKVVKQSFLLCRRDHVSLIAQQLI